MKKLLKKAELKPQPTEEYRPSYFTVSSSPIPDYVKTYNEPLYGFDASKAAVSYQDSPLNQNSSTAYGNVGAYGADFSLKYGDYS